MVFLDQLLKRVTILLAILMLVACSASDRIVKTYEGAFLADSQVGKLLAPKEIKIEQIDGVKQKNYLMENMDLTYDLLPGEHVIVYRYSTIWARKKQTDDIDEPNVEVVESSLRQIRLVVEPQMNYQFSFDNASNRREAAALATKFSASVVDGSNRLVAKDAVYDPKKVVALAHTNSQTTGGKPVSSGVKSVSPSQVNPVDAGLSRLEALKVLWDKASPEEKKVFLKWAFE